MLKSKFHENKQASLFSALIGLAVAPTNFSLLTNLLQRWLTSQEGGFGCNQLEQFCTGRMPFMSPTQPYQSIEET